MDLFETEMAALKDQLESIQRSVAQEIAVAMQAAIPTLQQTLAEQLGRSLEIASRTHGEELQVLMDRNRENQLEVAKKYGEDLAMLASRLEA